MPKYRSFLYSNSVGQPRPTEYPILRSKTKGYLEQELNTQARSLERAHPPGLRRAPRKCQTFTSCSDSGLGHVMLPAARLRGRLSVRGSQT